MGYELSLPGPPGRQARGPGGSRGGAASPARVSPDIYFSRDVCDSLKAVPIDHEKVRWDADHRARDVHVDEEPC